MGKFLYSASMSLDGFIAGPGGDVSWMTPYLGPNPVVDELVGDVGAILAGANTFRGDDPHRGTEAEGKAFGGGWEGPQFVLTRRPPAEPVPGVTFVDDLDAAIAAAAEAAGDKYVNVLGAQTARACLEAGALDEVLVCVMPVMLGEGVRLFEHPGGTRVRLERIRLSSTPQVTNLWYRVLR
jgi:riboflavin biosynthesis pyrimidine reductase